MALPKFISNDGTSTFLRSTDGINVSTVSLSHTYIWADERNMQQMLALDGTTVRRSTDGGDTWSALSGALPRSPEGGCIRVSATGTLIVGLANNSNGVEVARSINVGASWSTVVVANDRLLTTAEPYSGTFWECNDGSILMHDRPNAGLHDHVRVYRSTDDGASWSIAFAPSDGAGTDSGGLGCLNYIRGRAFLTIGDGVHGTTVYRSLDEGASWTKVKNNSSHTFTDVNSRSRNAIALRPDGTRLYLYVNSPTRRFFSLDNGATWTDEADPGGFANYHGNISTAEALFVIRDPGTGGRLFRSQDDGATQTEIGTMAVPAHAYASHQNASVFVPATPVALGLEIAPPRFNPIRENYKPVVRIY